MFVDLIFILLFTLLLVVLLVPIGGYTTNHYHRANELKQKEYPESKVESDIGIGATMLFFFFLIFPLLFIGNSWITPFGPVLFGVTVIPIILLGTVLALLVATLSPRKKVSSSRYAEEQMFGATFFSMILIALCIIVATTY